jgi:hypothetical protein
VSGFTQHPRWLRLALVAACCGALATNADAHLVVKGLDEVGNGALHPFVTPSHVLVMLALALLLGQQVPFTLRIPTLVMAPVSALALALTATGWMPGFYQPVLPAIALCLAVLVAMERRLPLMAHGISCALAVAAIGLDSPAETGGALATAKTLLGTWLALNLAVPYLAICVSNGAGRQWARTATRIAGSWIIAISLMVLAFALRR